MKLPMIGIVPLVDKDRNSLWMIPGYMNGVRAAGGIPVMLPVTQEDAVLEQVVCMMDGFLFTGGQDVNPSLYGAEKSEKCGEICEERDNMEKRLFQKAVQHEKPVLGICRGIQFINAVLGGTLYQDIPSEYDTLTEHHMAPPYDRGIHKVMLKPSPLYELLKQKELLVNSYHHQAVKDVSGQLSVMAESEDGLVEAVCMPEQKFVWGVQWHPELSFEKDENSRKIFEAFCAACRE